MNDTFDSAKVLEALVGDTDSAMATLANRSTPGTDLETSFADIQKKFDEAANIDDEREREVRLKVLMADFEELRSDAAKEEHDLAQAVFGLNAMLENMGSEYSDLSSHSPEEKKLVAEAEKELADAQERRRKADNKWFFKANAILSSERAIAESSQKIQEAKAEANRRARQRLLSADMEASLQEFMLKVEKTVDIMERRTKDINVQLATVTARKQKAFEVKEQAAKALQELDEELNQKEEELRKEEEVLEALENGSDEHAAQERSVSNLRAEVEDRRGKRNTAFVLHQSKDKFSTELEIHEKTQMKLRDNQRMWITSLRSDTEERIVTFRSRLEAMKAASDQDIAKNLDDLGAEADQRNAEYMARVGAASDRMRMEKIEKHPKRIAKMAEVAAAQAEAVQQIRRREQQAIEEFKERYGIDPTASSFFHYQDDEKEEDSSGPASTF